MFYIYDALLQQQIPGLIPDLLMKILELVAIGLIADLIYHVMIEIETIVRIHRGMIENIGHMIVMIVIAILILTGEMNVKAFILSISPELYLT